MSSIKWNDRKMVLWKGKAIIQIIGKDPECYWNSGRNTSKGVDVVDGNYIWSRLGSG